MQGEPDGALPLTRGERAQTMVEYVAVLSMITIAILAAFMALGDAAADQVQEIVGFL